MICIKHFLILTNAMINDMSVNQTYYVFGQINYTSASHVWERSWFL